MIERIDAVVHCKSIRVNNKAKLTNLMKYLELRGIMVNKGRIHEEIRDF